MDWPNETYVRLYTRETDDDLALPWEALALWHRMLTKFDRAGVIATKRGARGLAAVVRIPPGVVERVLPELLADGRLKEFDGGYLAPNFIAAQEASKSDKQRQRESRERRRANAGGATVTGRDENITNRDDVTERDFSVTERDRLSRENERTEQNVTLCSADLVKPDQVPDARTHAILRAPLGAPRAVPLHAALGALGDRADDLDRAAATPRSDQRKGARSSHARSYASGPTGPDPETIRARSERDKAEARAAIAQAEARAASAIAHDDPTYQAALTELGIAK